MAAPRRTRPIDERFWEHVPRQPLEGCWIWKGSVDSSGKGKINRGRRGEGTAKAHRVAWEIANGRPVPAGMTVRQTCLNDLCVRIDHLELCTHGKALRARTAALGAEQARHGEANHRSKLSSEQVAQIRNRIAHGATATELAGEFDTSSRTVQGIKQGRRRSVG